MVKHPRAEDGTDRDEEFLRRWSRRKAAGAGNDQESDTAREKEAPAPAPEPPPKTDVDMPPLESIDESTDMGEFFSPQVSEKLRRVALRKMFHLPHFNIVDGLDDYDDDFRTFDALGEIITADMRHQMELDQEQLASAQAREGIDEMDAPGQTDGREEDATQETRADPDDQGEADEHTAMAHDNVIESDDVHRDS